MENIGIHTEPTKASVITAPIRFDLAGDCGITIDSFTNTDGEAVYRIMTTDYVANQWNEYFASLSLALARVAVLTACIEFEQKNEGETRAFNLDPATFSHYAQAFIDGQVR